MVRSFLPNVSISKWNGKKSAEVHLSISPPKKIKMQLSYAVKCSCFPKRVTHKQAGSRKHDFRNVGSFWNFFFFLFFFFFVFFSPPNKSLLNFVAESVKNRSDLNDVTRGSKEPFYAPQKANVMAWSIKGIKCGWHFADALREIRLLQKT